MIGRTIAGLGDVGCRGVEKKIFEIDFVRAGQNMALRLARILSAVVRIIFAGWGRNSPKELSAKSPIDNSTLFKDTIQ
jgi:hypothetical protein